MRRTKNYQTNLIRYLKSPKNASEYLNAALEDGDREVFLSALRNVAEAHGGMTTISRKTHLSRVNLYRILSKHGNPEIHSLETILHVLGLKLSVEVAHRAA